MREYSKVSPVFWTGETGRYLRKAGSEAQIVCLYLITGPTANMIGLYELPLPLLAHHTGLTLEGASKGLRRGFEGGFCKYHEPSEMVWIPEMARYQIGESVSVADNRHKAIIKELFLVSKSVFLPEFLQKYGQAYSISPSIFEGALKVLARGFEGASKGLRSQEQEQEHIQQQEFTTPPNPPVGGMTTDVVGTVAESKPVTAIAVPKKSPRKKTANDYDAETDARFVEFWFAYPNKAGKIVAARSFAKLDPNPELLAEIMRAIEVQKHWHTWAKDNGAFIPHPATWLNQRRWEDEPPPAPIAVNGPKSRPKTFREIDAENADRAIFLAGGGSNEDFDRLYSGSMGGDVLPIELPVAPALEEYRE